MVPNKTRQITLGTLNINETAKGYIDDILEHNRLSSGHYTKQFESLFASHHDSAYGIFMNSGTSALQVALAALREIHRYEDGDEVLVPATTFIATSNIVLQNNLKPVFVDVNPETFNMNWYEIEKHITPRTRCIIPVHLFGLPANMEMIMGIARAQGLQVIEDSCETMFATQGDRRVGGFGDLACFSTYVAHLIVGGVGGVITTNDKKLEQLCRSLMAHGRDSIYTNIDQDDIDDDVLRRQMIERRYRFERVGYSYRATELEAAIALSELERWKDNILTRQTNASYLSLLLRDTPLQLPIIPAGMTHSFMMYPMVVPHYMDRDALLMHLERNGVETRYLFPLLSQPVYQKLFPGLDERYPTAKHLAQQGFFIGMHQNMTLDDMRYISDVIHAYFKTGWSDVNGTHWIQV
jgi:dTDP-4-amino-4,6-dideoxygalactose transaminase